DDAYVVSVPELPGLHTHGATVAEAAEMGEEAIATWLEADRRWGDETPPPPRTARRVVVDRPPQYDATRVRAIRERANVSQTVFAAALNVSPATVQSWEQGARRPDGPSLRLLELADRQPSAIFRALRPAKPARTAAGG
ncbi:MAG TPA: helix-turn-helix domain-containing protein, partial [Thermomicrobiales bacterium]|nr:helix-turn-helix domain-containing protein [Thermomicrobiales bacterium]